MEVTYPNGETKLELKIKGINKKEGESDISFNDIQNTFKAVFKD